MKTFLSRACTVALVAYKARAIIECVRLQLCQWAVKRWGGRQVEQGKRVSLKPNEHMSWAPCAQRAHACAAAVLV